MWHRKIFISSSSSWRCSTQVTSTRAWRRVSFVDPCTFFFAMHIFSFVDTIGDKGGKSSKHITQDSFVLWVALQVKSSILIFSLLQQQDWKDNTLCKWVSRREDTQIWVMPLLIPKMGLLYWYSVGSQMSLLLETASELQSMIYASLFHCWINDLPRLISSYQV